MGFEKVKYYYDNNLWSIERVWNVVGKVITPEQYEQIVKEPYESA